MVSFVRPARRILPRAHKEVTSQVPSVLLRRKLVLLPGATIRPECSSLHLHTTDAIPPQATTSSRSLSSCLPRRLGGVGKHTRRNQPSVRQYTELCHQARFSHKSREVQPYPLHRHRVARCQMAYDSRKVGHSSVQTRKVSRSSKGASHSKPLFAQRMGSPLRDAGLLGTDPNPPSTSTATSSPASVSGSSARQGQEKTHPITTQSSVTSVDGPKHPQWDRDLPTLRQCHPPVDRCLQFGLGGSHQQPVGLGLVEQGRGRSSHQSAGSSSSEVLHSAARTEGLPYSPLHRQFIGAVRDKKTFCKISIAMSGSCFTHSDSRRSILDHRDIQDLHPLEQQGGRPEQTTISDDGLDPPSEHLRLLSSGERSPGDRPHGDISQHEIAHIPITDSRPSGSGMQRIGLGLEPMVPNLHLPSEVAHPHHHQEAPGLQSPRADNSSGIPVRDLVPVRTEQITPTLGVESVRSGKEWTSRLRELDRIQFLKELYETHYGQTVANKLTQAFRKTTDRQTQSNWKTFQNWLPAGTDTVTPRTVLEFLIFLEEVRRLNPRTILNYRASLRIPLKLAFNIDFHSEEFSLLARNQFLTNPPNRCKIPQWSVDSVLSVLSTEEFNLRIASPVNLLIKTLFLTALASGNRVSELAATSRLGVSLTESKATLPTSAGFLFKNQSLQNPLPPLIQFPALDRNNSLCPVAALKTYIAKTESLPHNNVLFVNPSSGKPLSAGRLSYWLVRAIKLGDPLSPGPSGHDVRKIGHSVAFARGLDPQEILRNGFWHSPNVFIHRYLINNASSLTNFVAGRHK